MCTIRMPPSTFGNALLMTVLNITAKAITAHMRRVVCQGNGWYAGLPSTAKPCMRVAERYPSEAVAACQPTTVNQPNES